MTLDSAGKLSILSGHEHEAEQSSEHQDEHHWEVAHEVVVTAADLKDMPKDHSFSLALSYAEEAVFVTDPIAKQIKKYDLGTGELVQTIELDVIPNKLVWLGIARVKRSMITTTKRSTDRA